MASVKKTKYTLKEVLRNRDLGRVMLSKIKRKEYFETTITIDKSLKLIKNHFKVKRLHTVYDICSGHGFNALYSVVKNHAKYSVSIERRFPRASYRLQEHYNRFRNRVEYREQDIYKNDYSGLEKISLILSIHPCRKLAYRVCDIAIKNRLPIVIVPCCECKSPYGSFLDTFFYIDKYSRHCLSISEHLSKNEYTISTRFINPCHTPKNCIIIGLPKGI